MITAVGLCSKIRAGATLIQSSSFDPRIHSFLIVNRRDILLPSKYLGIESPRIRTVWGDGSGTVHVPAGLGIGMWGFGVGLVRLFGFGAGTGGRGSGGRSSSGRSECGSSSTLRILNWLLVGMLGTWCRLMGNEDPEFSTMSTISSLASLSLLSSEHGSEGTSDYFA